MYCSLRELESKEIGTLITEIYFTERLRFIFGFCCVKQMRVLTLPERDMNPPLLPDAETIFTDFLKMKLIPDFA